MHVCLTASVSLCIHLFSCVNWNTHISVCVFDDVKRAVDDAGLICPISASGCGRECESDGESSQLAWKEPGLK